MSTKEKTKPAAEEDAAEAKGGKKKLLIIAVVAVLALGAGGYFFLFSGSSAKAAPVAGGVLALDPIAVDLVGGGYLKIGVTLQLTSDAPAGEGEGAVEGSKAQDLIISTFSQANPADVATARDALKAALQQKIIKAYTTDGTEMVMGIYYNQYVTQ
jgi:flagellar protein FliL